MSKAQYNWQDDDLPRWASSHEVKGPFNGAIFSDHVTDWTPIIFTNTVLIDIKHGRVVAYCERLHS